MGKKNPVVDPVKVVAAFVRQVATLPVSALIYVGIDPGAMGAIAFVCGQYHIVVDMPVVEVPRIRVVKISEKKRVPGGPKTKTVHGKTSKFVDDVICRVFMQLKDVKLRVRTCLELAKPMVMGKGRNTIRVAYMVGIGFGMWPLFLRSKGYAPMIAEPNVWKAFMGLQNQDKTASLAKARKLFPKASLKRGKDHGRAEALLLAAYLKRRISNNV